MKLLHVFVHQSKEQGFPELVSDYGAQRARF